MELDQCGNCSLVDIKLEVKEESGLLDLCLQNEGEALEEVQSETDISDSNYDNDTIIGIEENAFRFCSQKQIGMPSENYAIGYNENSKDSEIKTKVEIKEEPLWLGEASTEPPCIYYDIKDGTYKDPCLITSPSLYKESITSYASDSISNEDVRNYVSFNMNGPECETARNCKSQENDVFDISSVEASCTEKRSGKTVSIDSCLTQNNLLSQMNTNRQDIIKENCKLILSHKHRKAHKCNICNRSFVSLNYLQTHKLIHEGTKPYKCDICNRTFTHFSSFKRHKLIHESIKPYQCDICFKAFTHLSAFKTHKMIHAGIKPNQCDICNRAFTHSFSLKRHKLIHEDIKPLQCDICKKTYSSLVTLKRHKMIHDSLNPNQCDICSKAFPDFAALRRHKYIHEGTKPNQCDICSKTFTQLSALKKHKLLHEGLRPHMCNMCNRAFALKQHLEEHKFIHDRKNPVQCDICNRTFTHLSSVKRHKLIHESRKPRL